MTRNPDDNESAKAGETHGLQSNSNTGSPAPDSRKRNSTPVEVIF